MVTLREQQISKEEYSSSLGPWGFVLSGLACACFRLAVWAFKLPFPWEPAVFDAAQFCAVGILLAAMVYSLTRVGLPRWGKASAAVALSLLLGGLLLGDDVAHFSRRQELLPQWFAYWGTVGVISFWVPASLWCGSWLGSSWARVGRRVAFVAAGGLMLLNELLLPHDYLGVHFFCALSALTLLGAALVSAQLSAKFVQKERYAAILSLVALLATGIITPSPAAGSLLFQSSGAAFAPQLARLHPSSTGAASAQLDDEWFKSREKVASVAPSGISLFEEEPLVVLITIDALRADLLLSREYDSQLPTLARLRDEGVNFTQARVPGTLTKVSLAGLFLGTYFSQQYWSQMEGRRAGILSLQNDETPRFVEALQAASISTHNFRSINWLRNGLVLRGFDEDKYIKYPKEKNYYTPSPPVFRKLLPRLKKLGKAEPPRPAFVYSHLSDPHAPYTLGKVKGKKPSPFRRYLAEVAYVDAQLSRLLALISQEPFASRTLLIVSSDHGEAFKEHGAKTHGTTLYEEELRVPLIFWSLNIEARQIDEPVTLMDLGPTILDIFSLPTAAQFMGQSLLPFVVGEFPHLSRPIFSETRLMRTMIGEDGMKLIIDTRSGRRELYDLKTDPLEKKNLVSNSYQLEQAQARMDAFFTAHQLKKPGYEPPFLR